MHIRFAQSIEEIEACFPVMVQLRTALSKETFVERVTRQQKTGYKLAFVEDNNSIVAIAGFRMLEDLVSGRFVLIDDLITDSNNRSKGYGSKLFDWIVNYAKTERCSVLLLNTGVQRFDAHKFYMNKGMHILAYHFGLPLVEK